MDILFTHPIFDIMEILNYLWWIDFLNFCLFDALGLQVSALEEE